MPTTSSSGSVSPGFSFSLYDSRAWPQVLTFSDVRQLLCVVIGHTKAVRIRRIHLAGPGQVSRNSEDRGPGRRWEVGAESCSCSDEGREASPGSTYFSISQFVRELLTQERSKLPLSETGPPVCSLIHSFIHPSLCTARAE